MKEKFVYRITDQDYNSKWASNYRDAQKVQRGNYAIITLMEKRKL